MKMKNKTSDNESSESETNQGVTLYQAILIAVITAILTTIGNLGVSIKTKEIEQENWEKKQDYLNSEKSREEYEKQVKVLLDQHNELRSLELELITLNFRAKSHHLDRNLTSDVLLSVQRQLAVKLEQHQKKIRSLDDNYQATLMHIGIFGENELSESVIAYFAAKMAAKSNLDKHLLDFQKALNAGGEYNAEFPKFVERAKKEYISLGQEEAFTSLIRVIRDQK
ncbi:TPA: hypothetical protein ACPHR2_004361 [Vibrio antiquarius]